MDFQISALDRAQFADLFELSDEELITRGAMRVVADKQPGFPCRVSLADAEPGENVLLVHYEHLSVNTPYRASHAVYVRSTATQARPEVNEIPEMLRSRVLSLRGFDRHGMLKQADLAEGQLLSSRIEEILGNADVEYVHLHFAKAGCYAARVDRV
jgi:hypothetical protein